MMFDSSRLLFKAVRGRAQPYITAHIDREEHTDTDHHDRNNIRDHRTCLHLTARKTDQDFDKLAGEARQFLDPDQMRVSRSAASS